MISVYYILNERNGKEVHDARLNTATSNYIVNQLDLDEPAVFFSIHEPTVMIGRYQNAYAEVDQRFLEANDIFLLRRLSGGGAVYHDMGNIMFMLTGPSEGSGQKHFPEYSKPILDAITSLGVEGVHASGRNDLQIGDQKFSGTSFYSTKKHFMFGATISYDLDKEVAEKVLKPNKQKLKAHRTKSVKGRMTTIKEHLPSPYNTWTTSEFRDYIVRSMFGVESIEDVKTYVLSDEDWAEIDKMVEETFNNPQWNWGTRSDFELKETKRFKQGTFEFYADIEEGKIKRCQLLGDFFAKKDVSELTAHLEGVAFQPTQVEKSLRQHDLEDYISDLTVEQLLTLIFDEEEDEQ